MDSQEFQDMLTCVYGEEGHADDRLIAHAIRNAPSLILDCSNSVNPKRFYHLMPDESLFASASVIQIEVIYSLRDALLELESTLEKSGMKSLVITNFDHLFHYSWEEENEAVMRHSWEIIERISKSIDVFTSISPDLADAARDRGSHVLGVGQWVMSCGVEG